MALPPSLSWLSALTKPPSVAQLQQLAHACGVARNGTRPVIAARLLSALHNSPTPLPSTARILSIDMGVRNFAYCLMTPVARATRPPPPSVTAPPPLALHDWRVLDLTSDGAVDCTSTPALAPVAADVVERHVLAHRPTHVLVELQRYRSGGAFGVHEWTLRVNALEAMLHASLAVLRGRGVWDGSVEAVDPGRSAPFFFVDLEAEGGAKAPAAKMLKKMRIGLLADWIGAGARAGGLGLASPHVTDLAGAFMQKHSRTGKRGSRVGAVDESQFNKLDDLADCVVQGAVWSTWQQTRHILVKHGVEEVLQELIKEK